MRAQLLDAALGYAAEGLLVFPCVPLDKRPLTEHGFVDATTDEAQVRSWWARWPNANIAIPTGMPETFDVFDVDVRVDGNGWAAFNRAKRTGLLAGAIRLVSTPSTGLHLYFPTSGAGGGSIRRAHVDFKARGGYVVVPPSFVVTDDYSGAYVEIDRREHGAPLDWGTLRRLLDPPRPAASTGHRLGGLDAMASWVAAQPEGNRNGGLFWACCRAIEDGRNDLDVLVDAAVRSGIGEREARQTVASAQRRAGSS